MKILKFFKDFIIAGHKTTDQVDKYTFWNTPGKLQNGAGRENMAEGLAYLDQDIEMPAMDPRNDVGPLYMNTLHLNSRGKKCHSFEFEVINMIAGLAYCRRCKETLRIWSVRHGKRGG